MKTTDFTLLLSCKKGKTNDSFSIKCFKERRNERRIEDDFTVQEIRETEGRLLIRHRSLLNLKVLKGKPKLLLLELLRTKNSQILSPYNCQTLKELFP